jgi:hypothetical protein
MLSMRERIGVAPVGETWQSMDVSGWNTCSTFDLVVFFSFRFFVQIIFALRPATAHVLRVRRGFAGRFRLSLIAAVSP